MYFILFFLTPTAGTFEKNSFSNVYSLSNPNTTLFSFHNSTSSLSRLHLQSTSSNGICLLDSKSVLSISSCFLDVQSKIIPFHSSGTLKLDALHFISQFTSPSLQTLVLTQDDPDSSSSVTLSNTILTDIVLSPSLGTFILSGPCSSQSITHSSFHNITLSDPFSSNSLLPQTQNEECNMDSVNIQDSQETFYGILCSGLTPKTISSFSATNSSFEKCIREFNPLSFHSYFTSTHTLSLRSNDANISNCNITDEQSTCPDLAPPGKQTLSGKNTFTYCSFSCKTKGDGGAIILSSAISSSEVSLTIENCSFKSCQALPTSDDDKNIGRVGGAISARQVFDVRITTSVFESCYGFTGGAVFVHSTQHSFFMYSCTFKSCSSYLDGSGGRICFSAPFSSIMFANCLFLQNGVKTFASDRPYTIGGGGVAVYINNSEQTASVANSLFAANSAENGGGMYIKNDESAADFATRFCVFAKNFASQCGEDIFFEGFQSNPILHSFTTSFNPLSVSYSEYDKCIVSPWLPQALWYITNANTSNSKIVVDRDAIITYNEHNTVDTVDYGCGLQGVSYPNTHSFFSSTQAQANNNPSSFSSY